MKGGDATGNAVTYRGCSQGPSDQFHGDCLSSILHEFIEYGKDEQQDRDLGEEGFSNAGETLSGPEGSLEDNLLLIVWRGPDNV